MRIDDKSPDWPERAWIMAGLLGLAGIVCGFLVDDDSGYLSIWRQLGATFLIVSGVAFALSAERLRLKWAVAFAVGAGAVLAFVGWFTLRYDPEYAELAEWPFLAASFGLLLATPLFQTIRDEGRWRFPYQRLHGHAWTDAVIGAASIAFMLITFLLVLLVGQLFSLIGITLISDLWENAWSVLGLAGASFGGAAAMLRERDGLLGTLQRVVQIILSVLAPILAAAVALFLMALPATGLTPLWETDHATPILLFCAAGALLFANAVIGNGREERSPSQILQFSALVLSLSILPFAIIAAVSMGTRIGQYGWTPERLWGAVAVGLALVYGAAYFWSVVKGRFDFDDVIRPLNIKLAIATCGLAILLAMPFIDFGAISTRSQLARLTSGVVPVDKFDWSALRYDFGPAGRAALARLVKSPDAKISAAAKDANATGNRWELEDKARNVASAETLSKKIRILPGEVPLPPGLLEAFQLGYQTNDEGAYALFYKPGDKEAVLVYRGCSNCGAQVRIEYADDQGRWGNDRVSVPRTGPDTGQAAAEGIKSGKVEIRTINRRQVFVNGEPVGEDFQ